jgi:hypothetical protein
MLEEFEKYAESNREAVRRQVQDAARFSGSLKSGRLLGQVTEELPVGWRFWKRNWKSAIRKCGSR